MFNPKSFAVVKINWIFIINIRVNKNRRWRAKGMELKLFGILCIWAHYGKTLGWDHSYQHLLMNKMSSMFFAPHCLGNIIQLLISAVFAILFPFNLVKYGDFIFIMLLIWQCKVLIKQRAGYYHPHTTWCDRAATVYMRSRTKWIS